MSRVQPPAVAPGEFLATPFAAKTLPGGQVASVAAMKLSMRKGLLAKCEAKLLPFVRISSWQVVASGEGEVRFTSFCSRILKGLPSCLSCRACADVAWGSPSTGLPPTAPHPPKRLSKL